MLNTTNIKKNLSVRIIWILVIICGLIIKLLLLPVSTGDYVAFLYPWIEFIKSHNYFAALKFNFYDYTPSYIYILIIIAKTGLNPLFSIKIISILFEYISAYFVGKIVSLKYQSNNVIWMALAIIPILPTVILNSSYLSQCDSIYSAFILGSVFFMLTKRAFISILLLAIAFAFKMQSAFILPFFFIMLIRGNIKWYYFLLIPFVFVLTILPAWFFGGNAISLLSVYFSQTDRYPFLTLNFPNSYIWIDNSFYSPVKTIGMLFTVIFTFVTGIIFSNKKYVFTLNQWIRLAFLSSIIIPFILPGMHERYMYLGDLSGVLYYLVVRKNIHLPIGILLVSFYSYIRCSRFNDVLPLEPTFVVYLLVIILLFRDFINSFQNEVSENKN